MNKEELKNKYIEAQTYNLSLKRFINGFYGAQANKYFKFFDINNAKSITAGGRYIIKVVSKYIEEDYGIPVIYNDTDSIFLNLGKYFSKKIGRKKFYSLDIYEQLELIHKEIDNLEKYIKNIINRALTALNSYDKTIVMEFELLSDYTIFSDVKKKYLMKKFEDENGLIDTVQLKIRNFDLIKSSTPEKIKPFLQEFLNNFMSRNFDKAYKVCKELERQIKREMNINDLSIVRKVNSLNKYQIIKTGNSLTFTKGTPLHIKAALLYNYIIDEFKLPYEHIKQGDLIHFAYAQVRDKRLLKDFDPKDLKVIGWKENFFPKDLKIEIDRNKIFEYITTEIKNIYGIVNIKEKQNPFATRKLVGGLFS